MRGDRLQSARERAGMTREELAEKVGKSYVTVGTWERGARKPKAEMLPVLASALNVSVDYLLGIDTEESADARRNIDTAGAFASCVFCIIPATGAVSVYLVPEEGFEPSRPCDRMILSHLRLPFRHFGAALFYHGPGSHATTPADSGCV